MWSHVEVAVAARSRLEEPAPRPAPGTALVERLTTERELDRIEPEWQRLADAAAGGIPFRTFEWQRAWWAHLRARGAKVRDSLSVLTVRAPSGELVAVAPFMRTDRPGTGPLRIRALEFFGADRNVTELRGALCAPGWDGAVMATLLSHLAASPDWDVVCWRGIRPGTAAHAVLSVCTDAHARPANPNYVLPLPRTWEEFRATRRRNIKESLRKCYNSLRRDGHAFTLDVARDEPAVAQALERFFTVHRARAALRDTVSHPDVFASAETRAFLADACGRLARRGMVRVFELRIGGAVVASRLGFALGDTLYLYFSGYDPAWRRYSVMTTTVAEAIRHAIADGFSWVNLSNSTDVAKTRWDPVRVEYLDFVQVAPGLRAHLASRAYDLVPVLRTVPALQFLRRRAAAS